MAVTISNHDFLRHLVKLNYPNSTLLQKNQLRQALLHEVRTCGIDVVVFHRNNSSRTSEVLAHRLGLCPINNNIFTFDGEDYRKTLHFTGPGTITTDDIPDIPFVGTTPIVQLQESEELFCEIVIRYGTGATHVKFSPVSVAYLNDDEEIVFEYLAFDDASILNPEEILQQALNTRVQPSDNIFFK